MDYDYDVIVIGSGFGGSVAALRLSEKGYRVAVVEQGKRVMPADMRAARSPLKLFWMPGLGLKGFFTQTFFANLNIVGGVGVGGGSLVYAAVLIEPGKELFEQPAWRKLGIQWDELEPYYKTAAKMLGRTPNPYLGLQDEYLKKTADSMGVGETYGTVPLGIYFGQEKRDVTRDGIEDATVPDPYFGGAGPARTGCDLSGACLTGCPTHSKNSLDLNYLYLAEKLGAVVLTEHQATSIRPIRGEGNAVKGYEILCKNPINPQVKVAPLTAGKVVLGAGVLGTLGLLFRCRDEQKTLPDLSSELGKVVRTNSEAIVGVLPRDPGLDMSRGTTISSDFYPDAHTHITQNRFPEGYNFMKWYGGPLVDDPDPTRRAFKTLWQYIRHPLNATVCWRAKNWHKRVIILTVMQHLDNQVSFHLGRSLFSLFRKGLVSKAIPGKSAPTYIAKANEAARQLAKHVDGEPINVIMENLLNMSTTAHILGGAQMGTDPSNGVINGRGEVFGYPGLYVVDGSVMPANLGVNPALTITALAERSMGFIAKKV